MLQEHLKSLKLSSFKLEKFSREYTLPKIERYPLSIKTDTHTRK